MRNAQESPKIKFLCYPIQAFHRCNLRIERNCEVRGSPKRLPTFHPASTEIHVN